MDQEPVKISCWKSNNGDNDWYKQLQGCVIYIQQEHTSEQQQGFDVKREKAQRGDEEQYEKLFRLMGQQSGFVHARRKNGMADVKMMVVMGRG